ncbi:helix-turn-helix domain-containing protein [Rhizobium sp. GN54]|uniref:helix-turn-helix domain-containing protein n=1 Tax=Rhizobium sp. GN54 TaxID=2898150 RepID=UPI001E53EC70|nr:helix-turn-helix domain-containing protein [Rhizobium sp. GN54]MCD2183311.1 helix-turn-helix domain-containing protein [Rhizobium sp. GN54]
MSKRNWKTTFQAGIFASQELRTHKIHRDLLSFLTFKAHQAMRVCWPSQPEMAEVLNCSVRNVHDLLVYLEKLGAIFPVKVSDLPKKQQATIRSLTPNKALANAKAYYLCEEWAHQVLEGVPACSDSSNAATAIPISESDREKGRRKANDRRRRYAPGLSVPDPVLPSNPVHDDWQFMNAAPSWTGSSTSAPELAWTGSPTTDMTIDINPDEKSAINIATALADPAPPSSQEKISTPSRSSLTSQHDETDQHGYGGGAAVACVPRPQALARPEGTEYDSARARATDRRVS